MEVVVELLHLREAGLARTQRVDSGLLPYFTKGERQRRELLAGATRESGSGGARLESSSLVILCPWCQERQVLGEGPRLHREGRDPDKEACRSWPLS